jgi:hypothetical protein
VALSGLIRRPNKKSRPLNWCGFFLFDAAEIFRLVWQQQRDSVGDIDQGTGLVEEESALRLVILPLGQLGQLDGAFTEFQGAGGVVIGAGHGRISKAPELAFLSC